MGGLATLDYLQFPVPPTDWPLLGMHFQGKYFWDGRIPFGARMASFVMQSIAQFITRALKKKGIDTFMYLDDIIMKSGSQLQATRQYAQLLDYLHSLGLKVASNKLQSRYVARHQHRSGCDLYLHTRAQTPRRQEMFGGSRPSSQGHQTAPSGNTIGKLCYLDRTSPDPR